MIKNKTENGIVDMPIWVADCMPPWIQQLAAPVFDF